ncbi:hypothetical protein SprV_0200975200 [Sparganum proliferum]
MISGHMDVPLRNISLKFNASFVVLHLKRFPPHPEICQRKFIAQFTSDIQHVDGSRTEVTEAQSKPSIAHLHLDLGIDLTAIGAEQRPVSPPRGKGVSGGSTPRPAYECWHRNHSLQRHKPPPPPFCAAISQPQSLPPLPHNSSHHGSLATVPDRPGNI